MTQTALERTNDTLGGISESARGALAMPLISADMMVKGYEAYRDLQHKLDKAMPEQIMELDGKPFRKKGYWRAIALAFNLSVEPVDEHRAVSGTFKDGRENFGWIVTYRATHPQTGRSQTGDGACFAVEKARRFRCPHPDPKQPDNRRRTQHFPQNTCPDFDPDFSWRALPGEATEHNVRGHAHTRAYNRAVSNLVGFGEVSAEEIEHDAGDGAQAPKDAGSGKSAGASMSGAPAASGGQPTAPAAAGVTTVASVKTTTGKNAKGPWTRYYAKFADGREGSTFSDTVGAALQAAKASGAPVNPDLETTAKGTNLKGLLAIVAAEPVHVDEPVNGPEKVLTVRVVQTDHGPRWIIQTDKRQLVTDQEAFAQLAVKAREDKVGVIPSFDVIKGASGDVNKLTKILAEVPADHEPGSDG